MVDIHVKELIDSKIIYIYVKKSSKIKIVLF